MIYKRKVLLICNCFKNGGIEKVIMDIVRFSDTNKFQFDLLVLGDKDSPYEKEFLSYGGNIKTITRSSYRNKLINKIMDVINYITIILKTFKTKDSYDIIHTHQGFECAIAMCIGAVYKIPIRVAHSHFANMKSRGVVKKIYEMIFRYGVNRFSTHKVGCADISCEWLYGKKVCNEKKTITIYNGVNLEEFKYKESVKEKEVINFIHVGRFSPEKNQVYLIEIFNHLYQIRNNILLTLIGYGELEQEIKDTIIRYKLEDIVNILPGDSKVAEILEGMDYVIFPSKNEGFSIALVEFQAMRLPCFVSTQVTEESNLGLCYFIELDKGPQYWARYIHDFIDNDKKIRDVDLQKVDIKNTIRKIENIYLSNNIKENI